MWTTIAARFALMSWFFEEHLAKFSPYNAESPREGFQIIGTSGTVTTVAASFLGLRRYDRAKVDGLRMSSDQIDMVIRDYLSLGPEGRRTDPRIGRDRHALIMSGAAILQALMRIWPTDRLSVADRGLREGLLYAQMRRGWRAGRRALRMTDEKKTSGRGQRDLRVRVKTAKGRKLSSTRWLERQLNDPIRAARQARRLSRPGRLQDHRARRPLWLPQARRAGGGPGLRARRMVAGRGRAGECAG